MSRARSSVPPMSASAEECEWDPSNALSTAWSTAQAARTQQGRGRRAYGRRGAKHGKGSAASAGTAGASTVAGGVVRHRKKRALRQRQMHDRNEGSLDFVGAGAGGDDDMPVGEDGGSLPRPLSREGSAASVGAAGPRAATPPMTDPIHERASSLSSLGDGTACSASSFDLATPGGAAATPLAGSALAKAPSASSIPPLPPPPFFSGPEASAAGGWRQRHSRSKSVSVFPGRPPVSSRPGTSGSGSLHQRSASVSLSSSVRSSFGSVSSSEAAAAAAAAVAQHSGHSLDRENCHPNLSNCSSNFQPTRASPGGVGNDDHVFSPIQPTKMKRLQRTPTQPPRPPPLAPSPVGWSGSSGRDDVTPTLGERKVYGGIAGMASSAGRKKNRRKKTRADEVLDQELKPLSPTPSSHSSATSFSSLSKTGDLAPTWVRNSLQECVTKWNSSSSAAAARPSHLQSGPFAGAIGHDPLDAFASPTKAHPFMSCAASPAQSLATCASASSRKRGVCDSPDNLLDGDDDDDNDTIDADACDLSSTGGLSSVRRHHRGAGAAPPSSCYRSRARSRIFGPDSAQKDMAAAAAEAVSIDEDFLNGGSMHTRVSQFGMDDDSSNDDKDDDNGTDESDHDDSSSDDNSDDSSYEGALSDASSVGGRGGGGLLGLGSDSDDGLSFPRRLSVRRSISDSFAESVFGAVDGGSKPVVRKRGGGRGNGNAGLGGKKKRAPSARGGKKKTLAATAAKKKDEESDPLESISSYDDLKFLIKALRRSVRPATAGRMGGAGGLMGGGGGGLSAVAGSMGCTIVLPQSWPSGRRGPFVTWATKSLGFSLRSAGGAVSYLQATADKAQSVLKSLEDLLVEHKARESRKAKEEGAANREKAAVAPVSSNVAAMPMTDLGCFSTQKKQVKAPPETPLFIITAPNRLGGNPCADMVSPLDRDVDGDLLHTMTSLSINERAGRLGNDDTKQSTSRSATAESRQEQQQLTSTLPCFSRGEMSVSPKDSSFEYCQRPPRHSGEHSTGDIMRHMMIGAPSPMDARDNFLPSRLTIPTRTPMTGGGARGAPLIFSTADRPGHPLSACINATPSFDIAETPLPPRSCQIWGSRPIPGRDWGESTKVDDGTIAVLVKRFDTAVADAELCGQSPMLNRTSPRGVDSDKDGAGDLISPPIYPSTSCFAHPGISSTAVSSAGLGFDFEADASESRLNVCGEDLLALDDDESGTDVEEDDDDGGDRFDLPEDDGLSRRRHTCLGLESGTRGQQFSSARLTRQGSVGATALAGLRLGGGISDDENDGEDGKRRGPSPEKLERRRLRSFAKRKRISLCAAALEGAPRISGGARFTLGDTTRRGESAIVLREALRSDRRAVFPASPSKERSGSNGDPAHVAIAEALGHSKFLALVLGFLSEEELLCSASIVCSAWADAATYAHASLSLVSVGCSTSFIDDRVGLGRADTPQGGDDDSSSDDENENLDQIEQQNSSVAKSMDRKWNYLTGKFPWALFLAEGGFKRVYKVWNSSIGGEEAVSVMDVDKIDESGERQIVGIELAVSVMLSSLVRRGICPNFILTRGIFTCAYEPPASHWGCADNKRPKGNRFVPGRSIGRKPREPSAKAGGRYQYIRMELCQHGDAEEFIKDQPGEVIDPCEARNLFFQMAFSLHVAGDRFGMKHYDVKLLNFFMQSANDVDTDVSMRPRTILRYGVGAHVFRLQMASARALIAKLADYGTANMSPDTNGQPVTIGQFTTIENTPPDFFILGDAAKQGYGHDCFGLGLCMLHLFTGRAPYEEILEEVVCPPALKKKLRKIWEDASSDGYGVLRSVILNDVYEDENGNIEGERDEIPYDTLYRFLVLVGVPELKFQEKQAGRVWRAITSTLQINEASSNSTIRPKRKARPPKNTAKKSTDADQFARDCSEFSLLHGTNPCIADARENLSAMDGGMELLLSLVSFDPDKRAMPLDVINSTLMAPLREEPGMELELDGKSDIVHSYLAYSH